MTLKLAELTDYNSNNWDKYYSSSGGIEYPHEQLVIYVNYIKRKLAYSHKPKALEIGFGSLADMRFLYQMGYNVYGLEVSQNAVDKALAYSQKLKIDMTINHWDPPIMQFDDAFFDFFCSSNSIHFNLDQDLILNEIHRILNDNGRLYTTYLAPGHKFINRSVPIGTNLIQFTDDHYVPEMRKMVMCYFESKEMLLDLYNKYFSDVRVTRLEYNILDAPNAYWIVTASKFK